MARRSGILHSLVRAQQEAERRRIANLRQQARLQTALAKAAEKARKDYEKAVAASQKERDRLYAESRIAQVNLQNEQLQQAISRLSNILMEALSVDSFINLQTLKQPYKSLTFNPGQLGVAEPPPVPDLFGTMQNEGASKGILITTSGYGQASYEFAEGKPIELLSGSNLLYLLAEHAGIEAKIEMPDNWRDPQPDSI